MKPRNYWRDWPYILAVAAVMLAAYFVGATIGAFS
jgi:hypothetical protein